MSNDNITAKLNYAIHPGEILQDALEEHQLTQKELANRIDVTPKHVNEIIKGKASITSTIAQKLEFVFNTSAGFWLTLQKNYEEISARLAINEQFDNEASLVDQFTCYTDLAKFGLVKATRDKKEKYTELLSFFGLSSLNLLTRNYAVQYRRGNYQPNLECTAAWLRIGEIHFKSLNSYKEFNEKGFRQALLEARSYTAEPIDTASKKLEKICADNGVVVAFTPYLKHTYVNGATRWFPSGNPLVQMTARMKRNDTFWFTFFHEAGHILKHSKKKSYVELEGNHSDSPEEVEANEFAANLLIPQVDYKKFVEHQDFTDLSIKTFSGKIGVGADIVAGRLARDGHIEWKQAMHLMRGIVVTADA